MRVLIPLLIAAFTALVLSVVLMNSSQIVTFRTWWNNPAYEFKDIQLAYVIIGATAAGTIFTGIVAVLEGMKIRLDNARLSRQIRELRSEIDSLHSAGLPLPLLDEERRIGGGGARP